MYYKGSFDYKGVDGRVYDIERQPDPPTQPLNSGRIYYLKQAQNMSLLELYQMEKFLTDGSRGKNIKPNTKDRDRILQEYPIKKDDRTRTYMGNMDEVWAKLQEKFPEATAPYKNYKACQYAVRYGAIEQVAWKKPDTKGPEAWSPDKSKSNEKQATDDKGFTKSGEWVAPSQRKSDKPSIEHSKIKQDVGPSR